MTRRAMLRLTSAALSGVFVLMLLGVGAVAAAGPTWTISATAIPDTVSPGSPAAYSVTIKNTGNVLIPFLFLTDSRSETPVSITPSKGCRSTGPLLCSLGPLAKGKSVNVVVVYQTPSTGSSFDVTFTATKVNPFPWIFWWTHRGLFAHIDASASTTLNSDPSFVGGYVVDPSQPISTADGDVQQTTLHPPKAGIGVTISESDTGNQCNFTHVIGQQVALGVGGGVQFSTAFLTTLKIQANTLDEELQLGQIQLCHQYDGAESGTPLPKCPDENGPGTGPACFWPRWGGAFHQDGEIGDEVDADDYDLLYIDVWDYQNGGIRGGF